MIRGERRSVDEEVYWVLGMNFLEESSVLGANFYFDIF